mmetsp:Transcript_1257/g.3663  ORF Transcript_1257/g.3663 Transcript_1257/m.3663 type:complete len:275 (-) Transcript_1257:651-1475(-)
MSPARLATRSARALRRRLLSLFRFARNWRAWRSRSEGWAGRCLQVSHGLLASSSRSESESLSEISSASSLAASADPASFASFVWLRPRREPMPASGQVVRPGDGSTTSAAGSVSDALGEPRVTSGSATYIWRGPTPRPIRFCMYRTDTSSGPVKSELANRPSSSPGGQTASGAGLDAGSGSRGGSAGSAAESESLPTISFQGCGRRPLLQVCPIVCELSGKIPSPELVGRLVRVCSRPENELRIEPTRYIGASGPTAASITESSAESILPRQGT